MCWVIPSRPAGRWHRGIHSDSTVFVNIGAKSEGTIDRSTMADPDSLGWRRRVCFVVRRSGIRLAEKLSGAGSREMLEEAFRGRIPVEGTVEGRNPGGFNVMLSGVKAFCPTSQIARRAGDDLDAYVGQTLVFLITEFKERDVVVSHRAHQEAQAAEEATQVWDTLKVGDIKDGAVATVQDFGVFIELGGVQGLLHKSELGQGADVTLPAVGDVVTVRVKSIDRAKERISLGLKDDPTGPWAAVGTDFVEGESYTGTVSRIMDFGAFVKLAEGLEGLVHISQLAHHRVDHPSSVVKPGQEVKAASRRSMRSASALVSACETTAEMAVVRGRSTSATKKARRGRAWEPSLTYWETSSSAERGHHRLQILECLALGPRLAARGQRNDRLRMVCDARLCAPG